MGLIEESMIQSENNGVDTLQIYQEGGEILGTEENLEPDVSPYKYVMDAKTEMFKKLYAEREFKTRMDEALAVNDGEWGPDSREAFYEYQNSRTGRSDVFKKDLHPIWDTRIPITRNVQKGVSNILQGAAGFIHWAGGQTDTGIKNEKGEAIYADTPYGISNSGWAADIIASPFESADDLIKDDGSTERLQDAFDNTDFSNVEKWTLEGLKQGIGEQGYEVLSEALADVGWDAFDVVTAVFAVTKGASAVKNIGNIDKVIKGLRAGTITKQAAKAAIVNTIKVPLKAARTGLLTWSKYKTYKGLATGATAVGAWAYNRFTSDGTIEEELSGELGGYMETRGFMQSTYGLDFSDEFIDKILTKVPGVILRDDWEDIAEFLKENNLTEDEAISFFMPEVSSYKDELDVFINKYKVDIGYDEGGLMKEVQEEKPQEEAPQEATQQSESDYYSSMDDDYDKVIIEEISVDDIREQPEKVKPVTALPITLEDLLKK